LKAKIKNQPLRPEQLFVKHVEFAEKFDVVEDLELASADDSFFEQFNLDIFGVIFLFALLAGFLVYKLLRLLFRCFALVSGLFNSNMLISRTKKLD
jgi:hypothetical protein